jgi:hypothetical protein
MPVPNLIPSSPTPLWDVEGPQGQGLSLPVDFLLREQSISNASMGKLDKENVSSFQINSGRTKYQ